jgi:threonine dehydrogenase-like Zn-dependent dehydrogenase
VAYSLPKIPKPKTIWRRKAISHELPLEQAPEGYRHFDERDEGWTKVVLKPAA